MARGGLCVWGLLFIGLCCPVALRAEPKAPTETQRKTALDKALALLAQDALTHPGGANGVVATNAIAGLAYISAGNTPSKGRYSRQLQRCMAAVLQNTGKQKARSKAWDQLVWPYSHALIFLSEYYALKPDPKVKQAIQEYIPVLQGFQDESGGWCHGDAKSGPNSLGYTTFTTPTICSLIALGYARELGFSVDSKVIDKGLQYIVDSSRSGVVGYSPRKGQKGFGGPGRNGGAFIAYLAVGEGKDNSLPQILRAMDARYGEMELGHGSALIHLMFGAWASIVHSTGSWDKFWSTFGPGVLQRQQADGSFTPPKGDGIGNQMMEQGDRSTATHALILALPECHLPMLGRLRYPQTKEKNYAMLKSKDWQADMKAIASLLKKFSKVEITDENRSKYEKDLIKLHLLAQRAQPDGEDGETVQALTEPIAALIEETQGKVRDAIDGEDMTDAAKVLSVEKKRFGSTAIGDWYKDAGRVIYWKKLLMKEQAKKAKGSKVSRRTCDSSVKRLRREIEKQKTGDWNETLEGFIRTYENLPT